MDVLIGIRTIMCCLFLRNVVCQVSSVRILGLPKNITVLQGSDVTFDCGVEKHASSKYVLWKKVGTSGFMDLLAYNNVIVDASKHAMHGHFSLTIRHVTVGDEGRYECQAGPNRVRVFLHVTVWMEDMTLYWSLVPPLTSTPLITLTCHVIKSRPPATVRWYHGGADITDMASTEHIATEGGFGDTYSVMKVQMAGLVSKLPFTCEASFPVLNVTRAEDIYPNLERLMAASSPVLPSMLVVVVALHIVLII